MGAKDDPRGDDFAKFPIGDTHNGDIENVRVGQEKFLDEARKEVFTAADDDILGATNDGEETVAIEGVPVRITDIPRTIAECWKHIEEVGKAVCLEAMKAALIERPTTTVDAIVGYTDALKITPRVMPYLEAMIS